MPRLRGGQVTVEFALSLVSVVAFLYVTLKVWMWLTTTIVERQTAFQATRLSAGQQRTAGMLVPYQPPRIQLVGAPGIPGGVVPSVGPMDPLNFDTGQGIAPCDWAQPYFDRAKELLAEAQGFMAQVNELRQQIEALVGSPTAGQTLSDLTDQLAQTDCTAQPDVCDTLQNQIMALRGTAEGQIGQVLQEIQTLQQACDTNPTGCQQALLDAKLQELNQLNAQLMSLQQEMARLEQRVSALESLAQQMMEQGRDLCNNPDQPPVFF